MVRNWQSIHPDFAVRVVSQRNRGQGAARNHGARLANAPLLLFTDADCVPVAGWAVAFLEAFRSPAAPDAAMGAYVSHQKRAAPQFAQLEFEERYARMARYAAIDLIATYSAAYRRDVFLAAEGFDESLAQNEDVEFSYRLSKAGKRLVYVPQAQVAHEHDATWANYAATKMGRGYWRTMVYRRHPGKAARDSYTPQLLKLQVLLAPLAMLALLSTLLTRSPRRLGPALLFLLTTLPMIRFGVTRYPRAALWAPVGSLVRALAFGVGIARALLEGGTESAQGREAQPLKEPKEAA